MLFYKISPTVKLALLELIRFGLAEQYRGNTNFDGSTCFYTIGTKSGTCVVYVLRIYRLENDTN